jgi:molybdopterin-guanine dinucleotide biosynthesis protein A
MIDVDAVVLAGGRAEPPLAAPAGTDLRALIPFDGKPFVVRVLEALRACERLRRIAVVGPERLRETAAVGLADLLVAEGAGVFENFVAGAAALGSDGKLLLTACDIPLLSARAFADFLGRAPDVDIAYPILRGEAFRAAFPGSENVLIPLREGPVIGGPCVLLDARALPRLEPAIARVLAARMSYARMVALLGVGFTVRFLLRRVSVADVERRVTALTGCTFRAVPDCDPVFPIDIDEPRDLEFLLRVKPAAPAGHGGLPGGAAARPADRGGSFWR